MNAENTTPIKKAFILDASAIYNGILSQNLVGFKYVPLCVIDEIQGALRGEVLLSELSSNKNIIHSTPGKESILKIKEMAKNTGDLTELSKCDINVLALALDIQSNGYQVEIISDDYDIQNLAKTAKIPYRGIYWKGITSVYNYYWECIGCRKRSSIQIDTCIECGSEMEKKVKKKSSTRKK
ncbi:MAG: NOB1 family endonuclease [Candidatus Thorarchaeota archaeon]